jgi:phage recombination protein Bet
MSTDLAVRHDSGVDLAFSPEQVELIKRNIAKDASDDELQLFLAVCRRTGLDPFARQVYFIKQYDRQVNGMVGRAQTSIDGFRLIADRSLRYVGQQGPWWCGPDLEWREAWLESYPPAAAKVVVEKLAADGKIGTFTGIARFTSYVQTKKDGSPTSMWVNMPDNQLAKCAEALALRKAFPQELSGLYTTDEMGQAANPAPAVTSTSAQRPSTIIANGKPVNGATGEVRESRPVRKPPTVTAKPDESPAPISEEVCLALAERVGMLNPDGTAWLETQAAGRGMALSALNNLTGQTVKVFEALLASAEKIADPF